MGCCASSSGGGDVRMAKKPGGSARDYAAPAMSKTRWSDEPAPNWEQELDAELRTLEMGAARMPGEETLEDDGFESLDQGGVGSTSNGLSAAPSPSSSSSSSHTGSSTHGSTTNPSTSTTTTAHSNTLAVPAPNPPTPGKARSASPLPFGALQGGPDSGGPMPGHSPLGGRRSKPFVLSSNPLALHGVHFVVFRALRQMYPKLTSEQLCVQVIKPITENERCSLLELIVPQKIDLASAMHPLLKSLNLQAALQTSYIIPALTLDAGGAGNVKAINSKLGGGGAAVAGDAASKAQVLPAPSSLVGAATCLVSHAWKGSFDELVDCLEQRERTHPNGYYWMDILAIDQHQPATVAGLNNFDWWSNSFQAALASASAAVISSKSAREANVNRHKGSLAALKGQGAGEADNTAAVTAPSIVAIMSPWNNPAPLARAWCLYEMFLCGCVDTEKNGSLGATLQIAIPVAQLTAFRKEMKKDVDLFLNSILTNIDIVKAECSKPEDKKRVVDGVRKLVEAEAAARAASPGAARRPRKNTGFVVGGGGGGTGNGGDGTGGAGEEDHGDDDESNGGGDGSGGGGGAAQSDTKRRKELENLDALPPVDAFNMRLKKELRICYLLFCLNMVRNKALEAVTAPAGSTNNGLLIFRLGQAIYEHVGDQEQALGIYQESLAALTAALGEKHADLARVHSAIGLICSKRGEMDLAIQHLEKCLAISVPSLGQNNLTNAYTLNALGNAYKAKGMWDKALECHEKELAVKLAALKDDKHADLARTYNNLGVVCNRSARYDKAQEYHEKELKIKLATLGENNAQTARAHQNLGLALSNKGLYDKAAEHFATSISIFSSTSGEAHPDTGRAFYALGNAFANQRVFDKALENFHKCLPIFVKSLGESHADTIRTLNAMGIAYKNSGDADTAIAYHEKELAARSGLPLGPSATVAVPAPAGGSTSGSGGTTEGGAAGDGASATLSAGATSALSAAALTALAAAASSGNDIEVARTYDAIAANYADKGQHELALQFYEKELALRLTLPGGENSLSVARVHYNIGSVYVRMNENRRALDCYKKDLGIKIENQVEALHLGKDYDRDLAASYHAMGIAYNNLGEKDKAQQCFDKELPLLIGVLGGEKFSQVAIVYQALGGIHADKGHVDRALGLYEKALNIQRAQLGDKDPALGPLYYALGLLRMERGELDKAVASFEMDLAVRVPDGGDVLTAEQLQELQQKQRQQHEAASGGVAPMDVSETFYALGNACRAMGDQEKARRNFGKGLTYLLAKVGEGHADLLPSYQALGEINYDMGDAQAAADNFQKKLSIQTSMYGEDNYETALTLRTLGDTLKKLGQRPRALGCYDKALRVFTQKLQKGPPLDASLGIDVDETAVEHAGDTARLHNTIGMMYEDQNIYDLALHHYEQSLGIMLHALGEGHGSLGYTYNNLGVVYKKMNNKAKAAEMFGLAVAVGSVALGENHPHTQAWRKNLNRVGKGEDVVVKIKA